MSDKCNLFVSEKYAKLREANKEILDEMQDVIVGIKEKTNSPEEFRKGVLQYIKQTGDEVVLNQNNKIRDTAIMARNVERVFAAKKGTSPIEGLASILRSTNFLGKDQAISLESIVRSNKADFVNFIEHGMGDTHMKLLRDEAAQKQIIAAFFDPKAEVPTQMKEVAEGIRKLQGMIHQRKVDAGMPVGKVENYLGSQGHLYSSDKFKAMKKDDFTRLMLDSVNLEETFPLLPAAKHKEYFENLFDGLREKQHDMEAVDFSNLKNAPDLIKGKLARRTALPRRIHFDPQKFGQVWEGLSDKTLLQSIAGDADRAAMDIGAWEMFGSQGISGFEALKQRVIRDTQKKVDAGTLSKEVLKDVVEGRVSMAESLTNTLRTIDGTIDRDLSANLGAGAEIYRSLKVMSLLGKSTIAAITDLANQISGISATTGQGYLRSVADVFSELSTEYPRAIREKFTKGMAWTNREMANYLHVAIEHGMANELRLAGAMQYAQQNPLKGKGVMALAKTQNFYSKINPIGRQASMTRTMGTGLLGQIMAKYTDLDWGGLHPTMIANFERVGITESDWGAFKYLSQEAEIGGKPKTKIVSDVFSDRIPDDVALKAIADNKASRGASYITKDVAQYKTELSRKLSVLYDTFASDFAAPNPGARERSILLQGTVKGTWPGEIARTMAMLKSFSVKMLSVQQRIYNSNPNGNAYGLFTANIMGLSAFGYGSMVLGSLIKNETPPDPTRGATVAEAMARGGAGGYWADFLINNIQRGGMKGSAVALIGPAGADLDKIGEMIGKTANGNLKGKDIRSLTSYLPGNNHFALEAAMKWTIADQWAEENDPGFRTRKAKRLRERQGSLWQQGVISE